MKIIKLDAIDSTNSFLKELAHNTSLENYTIVTAKSKKMEEGKWERIGFLNLIKTCCVVFMLSLMGFQYASGLN